MSPCHAEQTGLEATRVLPLALAVHVPPPTFDLTRTVWPVGKNLNDVMTFFVNRPFTLSSRLPEGLQLHPASAEALAMTPGTCPVSRTPDQVCLFTDGSFNGTDSAWAIVVVGFCQGVAISAEWFMSRLGIREDDPDWTGARAHGSQQGELSALCGALLWLLATPSICMPQIFSDSLTSVLRATGFCNFSEDDKLSHACKALFRPGSCE